MPWSRSSARSFSGRANGAGAGSPGVRGRPIASKKFSSPAGVSFGSAWPLAGTGCQNDAPSLGWITVARPPTDSALLMTPSLALALDLGPCIAQPNDAVEDRARRRRLAQVHAEVPLALELEARARRDAGQRRLQARSADDFERARVEHGPPVFRFVGLGRAEQMIVETHLGRDRVGPRRPVAAAPRLAPA